MWSDFSKTVRCRYFAAPGGCRKGRECRFRHDSESFKPATVARLGHQWGVDRMVSAARGFRSRRDDRQERRAGYASRCRSSRGDNTPNTGPHRGLCRYFATTRGCRYGSSCRYQHDSDWQPTKNCRDAVGCRLQNEGFERKRYDLSVVYPSSGCQYANECKKNLPKIAEVHLAVYRTNPVAGNYYLPPELQWELRGAHDQALSFWYRTARGLNLQKLENVDLATIQLTAARLDQRSFGFFKNVNAKLVEYRRIVNYLATERGIIFPIALMVANYRGFDWMSCLIYIEEKYTCHGN
jgi:hypothetical protein